MPSTLKQSMETGLLITFEKDGRQIQEVFLNWQDRPLPGPGDEIACTSLDATGSLRRRLVGTVHSPRRMEIARDARGGVSTWVRLRADLIRVESASDEGIPVAATNGKPQATDRLELASTSS